MRNGKVRYAAITESPARGKGREGGGGAPFYVLCKCHEFHDIAGRTRRQAGSPSASVTSNPRHRIAEVGLPPAHSRGRRWRLSGRTTGTCGTSVGRALLPSLSLLHRGEAEPCSPVLAANGFPRSPSLRLITVHGPIKDYGTYT